MKVTFISSLKKYTELVEPLLLKKEACNNLMLGILDHFKSHLQALGNGNHYGIVYNKGEPVYAFIQTPPHNWIFADVDDLPPEAIQAVAAFMDEQELGVPGIIGPTPEVSAFVQEWTRLTNIKANVHMEQLIYQLDSVISLPATNGSLVKATKQHKAIISRWIFQFGQETNEDISRNKADEIAENYTHKGTAYLWMVANKPVSMVNRSRKTKHGATVNAVYTPDEHKRNGYASSAVASLSQKLLDEGFQFCSLYTDLANPTSNTIYKKIGYYEVGSSIVYTFEKN